MVKRALHSAPPILRWGPLKGTRGYPVGAQVGRERYGPNHKPLTAEEAARWARLEADKAISAWRDRMHKCRLIRGLGLCAICYGFVDDPRHTEVGAAVDLSPRG